MEFKYLRLNYLGLDLLELYQTEIIALGLYSSIYGSDGFSYTVTNALLNTSHVQSPIETRITALEPTGIDVSQSYSNHDGFMARVYQGQIFQLYYVLDTTTATSVNFRITYVFNRVYLFKDGNLSIHD